MFALFHFPPKEGKVAPLLTMSIVSKIINPHHYLSTCPVTERKPLTRKTTTVANTAPQPSLSLYIVSKDLMLTEAKHMGCDSWRTGTVTTAVLPVE